MNKNLAKSIRIDLDYSDTESSIERRPTCNIIFLYVYVGRDKANSFRVSLKPKTERVSSIQPEERRLESEPIYKSILFQNLTL